MKPAYELPPSRTDEGVDGSFVRGTACFERKTLPPSLMCFQRTANNAAHRVTGMDVIAQTGAPAHRETGHARSTQRNHVSRETGSRPYPLANSACLSQVHGARPLLPFTISSCAVERPCGASGARKRIQSTQRCDEACRTAATRRRGSRRLQTSRTRIGSHRQHGATPPARSTQSHVGLALAPATEYRYCVHLFHVKPAVGCGLIRFLRRRAWAL